MNNLAKITDAVHRWGEYGAIYVGDYNNEFANHRYCEPGVKEPQPDRDETWFFESHTPGDGQISPSARDFGKPGKGENSAFGQQLLKHVLPNFKSVDDIKKAACAGKLPANARPDIKNSRDEWDALLKRLSR